MDRTHQQTKASARRGLLFLLVVLSLAVLAPGCGIELEEVGPGQDGPLPVATSAAEIVLQSTVQVSARESRTASRVALGTGVILSEDGLIVTNDHVITAGGDVAGAVRVILPGGNRVSASILGRSPERDLAFLRADADGLTPATLQPDLGEVERGGRVIAVGAPYHFDEPVARGRVTRVLRNVRARSLPGLNRVIMTSAQLEQGFSGGPLADEHGRIIGINVAISIMRETSGGQSIAIPVEAVIAAADELGFPLAQSNLTNSP